MVAAAAAPARPVPTTMMVNLRLLAGLTSFMSNLCFSHFSSIGPDGTRPLSVASVKVGICLTVTNGGAVTAIVKTPSALLDSTDQHRHWDNGKANANDKR